ncbi:MAG: hypothetical protein BGO63_11270 [Candidatus Accumulibacter sp. 66-26]|nr:hypothetical protein [Accumulibacter sp.]OJW50286.1 MAG: hypothetical protein BGO63_11270 [Candidatus Accumulibacter sp. 66-26]
MAKYDVTYACGHAGTEQLFGKVSERERRLAWIEANKVCAECYKAQKTAEDATAPMMAKLVIVPAAEPIISIEVAGQIEAHKDALYEAGYSWSDSTAGGLVGYLSVSKPKRVLSKWHKLTLSVDEAAAWINTEGGALATIGYKLINDIGDLDMSYIGQLLQRQQSEHDAKAVARAAFDEIKARDPRPVRSPLRERIAALEASSGGKWNGKIYGKPGGYNFYVADTKYSATDAEVAERASINAAIDAWDQKYAAEIAAAK